MSDWKLPWRAGCRCGGVELEIAMAPLVTLACHCRGCQRMTASAYSLSIAVPAPGFRVVKGEPVIGGLHGASRHFHCPHCKSWLFTRPEGMDDLVNVRATMLEDPAWFAPFVETCTAEAFAWAKTGAAHSFEKFPAPGAWAAIATEFAARGPKP